MKRFTLLTMLVALLSVTAFAQKKAFRPTNTMKSQSVMLKDINRQARLVAKKTKRAAEVYTYSFTQALNGWTTIDADGDGFTWELSLSTTGHDGKLGAVQSGSYDYDLKKALTPDNYLVSPKMKLDGKITFYACAQDASYPAEVFGVAVSTTGKEAADFTMVGESWTMKNAPRRVQGNWYEYSVDLSSYNGAEGYVAIRHFNCTDNFYLNVDDITLETSQLIDPYDASLEEALPEPEVVTPPSDLQTEVYTLEATFIDSYENEYNENRIIQIGIQGSDVYIQGFSHYVQDAWVKGTLNAGQNAITIPSPQYYGSIGSSPVYFIYNRYVSNADDTYPTELVLGYDATTGEITLPDGSSTYFLEGSQAVNDWACYGYSLISSITKGESGGSSSNEWIASEQEYGNGDVVGNVTLAEGVTGVFAKAGGSIDPKYYDTGTAVRMYAGNTLTITSAGDAITKIAFTFDTNNGAKIPAFDVSTGDIAIAEDGSTGTWTGEAKEIVFTVPSTSGQQTRIQKIEVFVGEQEPEVVVAPEDLETKTWYLYASGSQEYVKEQELNIGIDGSDIYIQGLCPYLPEAWVKGTVEGNSATIPSGQYYGAYEYEDSSYPLYFVGGDMTTGEIVDLVLTIDDEAGKITTQQAILLNGSATELSIYDYYSDITIVNAPIPLNPVAVPETLQTETYLFSATEYVEEEEVKAASMKLNAPRRASGAQPYSYQMQVGFDGKDVYFKGFSENTAEFWAKGTLSEDGKTVTIPANQYLGTLDYLWFSFDYFITAFDEEYKMADIVLNYDAETKTFSTSLMALHDGVLSLGFPYQIFTDVTITKMAEVAATPANPSVAELKLSETSYPYATFEIPAVGTNEEVLLNDKMSYVIWIEKGNEKSMLTLTKDLYENLEADMTEIPYSFTDNYDFYLLEDGYRRVYLNQDVDEIASWSKIGIQSIYRGGGEEHKSEIVWAENPVYAGIAEIKADMNSGKTVIYNMAGQRVESAQKGLYIVNGKKVVMK